MRGSNDVLTVIQQIIECKQIREELLYSILKKHLNILKLTTSPEMKLPNRCDNYSIARVIQITTAGGLTCAEEYIVFHDCRMILLVSAQNLFASRYNNKCVGVLLLTSNIGQSNHNTCTQAAIQSKRTSCYGSCENSVLLTMPFEP